MVEQHHTSEDTPASASIGNLDHELLRKAPVTALSPTPINCHNEEAYEAREETPREHDQPDRLHLGEKVKGISLGFAMTHSVQQPGVQSMNLAGLIRTIPTKSKASSHSVRGRR